MLLCVIEMTMQEVAIAPVNATLLLTGMLTKREPDCAALHHQRTHAPQHGHIDNTGTRDMYPEMADDDELFSIPKRLFRIRDVLFILEI